MTRSLTTVLALLSLVVGCGDKTPEDTGTAPTDTVPTVPTDTDTTTTPPTDTETTDTGTPTDTNQTWTYTYPTGGTGSTTTTTTTTPTVPVVDNDNDGYGEDVDCDDTNPDIHPGAFEVCDGGVDNDCDGFSDDSDSSLLRNSGSPWYLDADGDGAGNSLSVIYACVVPFGRVEAGGDCDDDDADAYPDAQEVCDGVDNDCDELVDDLDDSIDESTFGSYFVDLDGDGFGSEVIIEACGVGPFVATNNTDCDDTEATAYPGAPEGCDGFDNDCDGLIDDADQTAPTLTPIWYQDNDGDGYGVDLNPVQQCTGPANMATTLGDCDDSEDTVHPDAPEVCDGIDNDCDSLIDDADEVDPLTTPTYYADFDSDGFGDSTYAEQWCVQPPLSTVVAGDCNDNRADVNPDAPEICDGVDNDCDELADDADLDIDTTVLTHWFEDLDHDGAGAGAVLFAQCTNPDPALVNNDGDCNDEDDQIHPGALEQCDTQDNDCDGVVDDAVFPQAPAWFSDEDGDGYGINSAGIIACDQPFLDYVLENGDCDDSDVSIFPGALEICDTIDNDCDGLIDDDDETDPDTTPTYYLDRDSDGFGDGDMSTQSCIALEGAAIVGGDCDDFNDLIHPDAQEICDGVDNDCDDGVDDADLDIDPAVLTDWYTDTDLDGYGVEPLVISQCEPVDGAAASFDDCNDNNVDINPGAYEICDGEDNNCSGDIDDAELPFATAWFFDGDVDGFGSGEAMVLCEAPGVDYVEVDGDCQDDDASINPDAVEICDEIDNDCDELADDADESLDLSTATTWFADLDGDLFGDDSLSQISCVAPEFGVTDGGDCDDDNGSTYPGAVEVNADGTDSNCDMYDSLYFAGDLLVSDLRISEILVEPVSTADVDGDWFEVYNTTDGVISLLDLTVSTTIESHIVAEDVRLEPGDYTVFGSSLDAAVNGESGVSVVYGDLSLNNTTVLTLQTEAGVTVDSFDANAYILTPGVAWQLDGVDGLISNDWCDATTVFGAGDLGTPGVANAECP